MLACRLVHYGFRTLLQLPPQIEHCFVLTVKLHLIRAYNLSENETNLCREISTFVYPERV